MTQSSILPITNITNVSIQDIPAGLGVPNVNNVLLLTSESPSNLEVYGDYVGSAQVAEIYGTKSVTTAMANAIFGQSPNILSGDGTLIIAHTTGVSAVEGYFTTANISANLAALIAVTSGDLKVTVNAVAQNLTKLNFTACTTLADIAAVLQAALINCNVTAVGNTLKFTSTKVGTSSTVALAAYSGGGTDLTGAGLLNTAAGSATPGVNSSGETTAAAIARLLPQVFFAGVITSLYLEDAAITAAAAAVQAQDMLFLHQAATTTDIAGIITSTSAASYKKTRLLPYFTGGQSSANLYKSAYAGRGYNQDFTGSDTSFTMHMKQLVGILPDAGMNQTFLTALETAGGDPYISTQGYPMVYSTGGNDYFDNQYSNLALKFSLSVAGFNYLAQTNTKVPQTETGMNGLKSAYIKVLEQFVNNGELAPGEWNSSQTFGDPETFRSNIREKGYFIYSTPVADQSSSDRNQRKAPLVQIACKRAGAIQSSNVIVIINN